MRETDRNSYPRILVQQLAGRPSQRAGKKCRISGLASDLLNVDLHLTKFQDDSWEVKFGKHRFIIHLSKPYTHALLK